MFSFLAFSASHSVVAAPMTSIDQETFVAEDTLLRVEPQADAEPMAKLRPGVKLELLSYGTSRKWIRVRTESGREGWVRVEDTSLVSRRAKPLYSKDRNSGDRSMASIDSGAGEKLEADDTVDPKTAASKETKILGTSFYVGAHAGFHWGTFNSPVFGARGGVYFWATPSFRAGLLGLYDYASHSKTSGATNLDRKEHHTFLGVTGGMPWGLVQSHLSLGWDYTQSDISLSDVGTGRVLTKAETGGIAGVYNEHALGARIGLAYEIPMENNLKAMQLVFEYGVGFYGGPSLVPDDLASFPQQVVFGVQGVF